MLFVAMVIMCGECDVYVNHCVSFLPKLFEVAQARRPRQAQKVVAEGMASAAPHPSLFLLNTHPNWNSPSPTRVATIVSCRNSYLATP